MEENKRSVAPINKVSLAEHELREYVGYVAHGVTIEDVTKPEYWAYVAERFVPLRTYIDLVAEDGSWIARLLVMASSRNWAQVHIVYHHDLSKKKRPVQDSEFVTNFAPAQKWRIVRKSDKEVIMKDFTSQEEADKALRDYEETLKR